MWLVGTFVDVFPAAVLVATWSPVLAVGVVIVSALTNVFLQTSKSYLFDGERLGNVSCCFDAFTAMSFNYPSCKPYIIFFQL